MVQGQERVISLPGRTVTLRRRLHGMRSRIAIARLLPNQFSTALECGSGPRIVRRKPDRVGADALKISFLLYLLFSAGPATERAITSLLAGRWTTCSTRAATRTQRHVSSPADSRSWSRATRGHTHRHDFALFGWRRFAQLLERGAVLVGFAQLRCHSRASPWT
jgi:hypothetical protein